MKLEFFCSMCGEGVESECEGEPADGAAYKAAYWDCVKDLRGFGWQIGSRYATLCPPCRRKESAELLDKPVSSLKGWR